MCHGLVTAMKKKAALATVVILSFLFISVVSPQFVGFAKAQREPVTIGVEIQSPSGSYADNSTILITLNVELVYGTTEARKFHNFSSQNIICKYSLDNGEWVNLPFIRTTSNKVQFDLNFPFVNIIDCNYGTVLSGLSVGTHFINVTTYPYPPDYFIIDGNMISAHEKSITFGPSQINFTVYSPLSIAVISPQNQTYHSHSLKLSSIVNQETLWMGYSIDHQANETMLGNTTLTELSYGSHSLTLYANGTFGNTGESQTIYFDIQPPEPFPTLSVAIAFLVGIVVVFELLVYFKKRKR
jgi:hypothetical protein